MGAASDSMSYWDISSSTSEAVSQTVIVCVTGFWAAKSGYLDRSAQKSISTSNVMVFTPCLVFSKIASQLSVSALIDISSIPVIFAISTGISYMCGQLCSRQFKFNERESNFVTAMAVFGNSNSVPVSLFLNLAASSPASQWPDIPGDNADNVASRGSLYSSIFQQLGQMLRWSWGFNTSSAPIEPLPAPAVHEHPQAVESNELGAENDGVPPKRNLLKSFFTELKSFMNPPLWAMSAAVVVASVPPSKNALYGGEGFINQTVGRGIQQVGATAVPLILVVLGSNSAPPSEADSASQQRSPRHGHMIFASLVSRMISPASFLSPLIASAVRYSNISILDDPAFLVATFILTGSPPAIQLSQICQSNNVFEAEMAGVLFWGYVVLSSPSAILIVTIASKVSEWSESSVSAIPIVAPIIQGSKH